MIFETEFRKPFNVQSQHEITSCHSVPDSWARFPSTQNLNPVLAQSFSVPFAVPTGEASAGEIQGAFPGLAPMPGGFPPHHEWLHSSPKSSSGGTGVLDLLGLLIQLLPMAFHINLWFFLVLIDSSETPNQNNKRNGRRTG